MIKQTDIAIIILVASVSLVASYFIGDALINTDASRSTEVEVVTPISADFPIPSPEIFNDKAINPTELIKIGDDTTDKPFRQQEN